MNILDKSFAEGNVQDNTLQIAKSKTWRVSVAPL